MSFSNDFKIEGPTSVGVGQSISLNVANVENPEKCKWEYKRTDGVSANFCDDSTCSQTHNYMYGKNAIILLDELGGIDPLVIRVSCGNKVSRKEIKVISPLEIIGKSQVKLYKPITLKLKTKKKIKKCYWYTYNSKKDNKGRIASASFSVKDDINSYKTKGKHIVTLYANSYGSKPFGVYVTCDGTAWASYYYTEKEIKVKKNSLKISGKSSLKVDKSTTLKLKNVPSSAKCEWRINGSVSHSSYKQKYNIVSKVDKTTLSFDKNKFKYILSKGKSATIYAYDSSKDSQLIIVTCRFGGEEFAATKKIKTKASSHISGKNSVIFGKGIRLKVRNVSTPEKCRWYPESFDNSLGLGDELSFNKSKMVKEHIGSSVIVYPYSNLHFDKYEIVADCGLIKMKHRIKLKFNKNSIGIDGPATIKEGRTVNYKVKNVSNPKKCKWDISEGNAMIQNISAKSASGISAGVWTSSGKGSKVRVFAEEKGNSTISVSCGIYIMSKKIKITK